MIKTDLPAFENDLKEVMNLFAESENLTVRHLFKESERKVVNTMVFAGKSYAYGNLLPQNLTDVEKKRYLKRYAKLALYKALSAFYGVSLPWGALTGIRPTKLAYQQLKTEGEFEDFFVNTMKVSSEKTALTRSVIESQKGVYQIDDQNTDFFVFIPFCPSRCKYCSFISADIKGAQKYVDVYVDTLIREIEESARLVRKLRSIYIGGGTPVALSDEHLERILRAVDKINTGVEYTVEAGRPDRITESNLKLLKAHGVTRLCINPQTFNDKTLQLLGRNHTAKDLLDKYELAKNDFSINMDLIAGLTGESLEDFKYSLDTALSLRPDNITVHTLCIKRGSYLAEEEKRIRGEDVSKMVDYARERLVDGGYKPYYMYRQKYMAGNLENVGYALPDKACVYNIDIMEEIACNVACGANAVSKVVYNGGERIERSASPKDVKTYIDKIDAVLQAKTKLFS